MRVRGRVRACVHASLTAAFNAVRKLLSIIPFFGLISFVIKINFITSVGALFILILWSLKTQKQLFKCAGIVISGRELLSD